MRNINIYLLFIFLLSIVTYSCDKIDVPYYRDTSNQGTKGRNVLLEEFTGHKCPNCPEASKEAHELQTDYPELILVSVHAGAFATPNTGGLFVYDFRCSEGEELNTFFDVSGYPTGMVNRTPVNDVLVPNPSLWATAIASFQDNDPIATLTMTNTYDTLSREVSLSVSTEFLENYLNPLNITVYITEDSIIKPQYNNNPLIGPTPYIENYVHRHVLRASFNGTFGSQLTSGNTSYGAVIHSQFNTVLDTAWRDKQCYMVAFITDRITNEVMQVEEKRIR